MNNSYTKLKNKLLKNPEVRKEYELLGPEYEIIMAIIDRRLKRGWSQKQLAEKIGTRQPVISRLERGEANPSLAFLRRVAGALDTELRVSLRS
jgi:ribosome-binding protein aMBF1 (putative translation factor)